jgi:uncharacterized protein with HEPN domain
MTDQGRKFLSAILRAIDLIGSFTSDLKDYNSYVSDLKTQSAVERQLGIIGEAVSKFEKLFAESPLRMAVRLSDFATG